MDINDFKDHLTDLPPEKRKLFVELLEVKKSRKRTHRRQGKFLGLRKIHVAPFYGRHPP